MTITPRQETDTDTGPNDITGTSEKARNSTNALGISATAFANAMNKAFADATTGGKRFDDVLKQLALRLSSMALAQAYRPLTKGIIGGLSKLIGDIFGDDTETQHKSRSRTPTDWRFLEPIGGLTPFAAGGVIGTPTYFPLTSGGFGLAGEAGPEAIMPLTRGPDGRLGVSSGGAGPAPNITVQITTPDAQSFRRSEAYITGQIARAVARGQRNF